MNALLCTIRTDIINAINGLFKVNMRIEDVVIRKVDENFKGHYSFTLFQISKRLGLDFTECGTKVGEYLLKFSDTIDSYEVIHGFLNLTVKNNVFIQQLQNIVDDEHYGHQSKKNETIVVEYSSPNTNKPLHLGHLRNNFIGFAISSILKAVGYNVVQVCLVNDRGMHICKSMIAYQKLGNDDTPQSTGIKGDHFVGKYYVEFEKLYKQQVSEYGNDQKVPIMLEVQNMLKMWEEGDNDVRKLWKQMNDWVYEGFKETYDKIGIHFDKVYYESQTYLLGKNIINEGLDKYVFLKKDDGSVWIDLTDDGLDQKLLLRSDGTSVYITQDLGTADLRYKDFSADKMVYVVGNEQDYHFNVLKLILKKLCRKYADGIYHLSYGMVDLPCGKMKSREGTVVDADDIIDEMITKAKERSEELGKVGKDVTCDRTTIYKRIGLAALKFYMLHINSKKRLMFDPNKSIDFQGDTGPFILYTYVRIQSILKKIGRYSKTIDIVVELDEIEKDLIITMTEYPDKLNESAQCYEPSILAQYLISLVKMYNRFYEQHSIVNEMDDHKKNARICISAKISYIIEDILSMFGIDIVTVM